MRQLKVFIFSLFAISIVSCAYFNTLFNAEEKYDSGVKKIEESKDKIITKEIKADFQAAIDKCWKLLNIYSDSSKYADDALLIIGKSHYHMEEYVRSERFLAQFVDRYRDSDMIAEAYLWLGMSLIELERYDEALVSLNKVLDEDESNNLNARAFLNIGRVFINQDNYDQARIQFGEVFNSTGDDEIQGNAQFLIAETYFLEESYTESIDNFEKVLEYDASANLLFRAVLRKVDGYLNIEDYEQAIFTLESISSETKFLYKKSVIQALIGNCYEDQGKYIEATEIYDDVLETYPRTEGSAIAAFGMAQLMQFAYADLDSAKGLYMRVTKEYRDSEYKEESDTRVKLITSYQKIEKSIEQDLLDLDALTSIPEEGEEEVEDEDEEDVPVDTSKVEIDRNAKNTKKSGDKPTAKRSESEIRKSLERNNFARAEFFLLSLASYDSAAAGYARFIQSSDDSLLVPKAQYALYYIYAFELYYQDRADSVKQIILSEYPQSPYAVYFNTQKNTYRETEEENSPYQYLYLQGEAMMSDEMYFEAIDFFDQIAEDDSGSDLALKARYASAWIYENKLEDIENAVTAYTSLAEEYPNSEAGKIAQNKIKAPPEIIDSSEVSIDNSTPIDSSASIPSLDEELDISDQSADNVDEEEPQNPDE